MGRIICSFKNANLSMQEQKGICIKEGIDLLSVDRYDDKSLLEISKDEILEFKKKDVEVAALESMIGYKDFDDDLEEAEKIFSLAKESKIKMVICYGYFPFENNDKLINHFTNLADMAKKNGIQLLIRNHSKTNFNSADKLLELVTTVNRPNFKVLFDTKEFIKNNEIIMPAYRHLKKEIGAIYINDSIGDFNTPIGMGEGNIIEFLKILENDDYKGNYFIDLDFNAYLKREKKYREFNPFKVFSKEYKIIRMIDEKLEKKKNDKVTYSYLASLQLRYLKHIIKKK